MAKQVVCYAARDENGDLFLYKSKPARVGNKWQQGSPIACVSNMYPQFLKGLKWEDKPARIKIGLYVKYKSRRWKKIKKTIKSIFKIKRHENKK